MTKFHDLDFIQSADGTVQLIQTDCGEDYSIAAHPEQILFIARRLCGMTSETAEKVAELERRLSVLTDRLQNIVCREAFRSDLIKRCGNGFEYIARLDALLDLALEFDGGRLEPEYMESEQQKGHMATKPIHPPTDINSAKRSQPGAITEGCEQLGLEV